MSHLTLEPGRRKKNPKGTRTEVFNYQQRNGWLYNSGTGIDNLTDMLYVDISIFTGYVPKYI